MSDAVDTGYTLYHLPTSRSSLILFLLKELNLKAEVDTFENLKDVKSRPDYDEINAFRKIPSLRHASGTLFESGAIVAFILSQHGKGRLQPATDSPQYPKYLQFSWFAEATLAQATSIVRQNTVMLPEEKRSPKAVEIASGIIRTAISVIEAELQQHGGDWILGSNFSSADIQLVHGLRHAEARGALKDFPVATKYFQRLTARPAFQEGYSTEPALFSTGK